MRIEKWTFGSAAALAAIFLLQSACFTPVCEGSFSYCIDRVADGGREQCIDYPGASKPRVCAPVTPVVCAGSACGAGEACCLTTGKCFAKDTSSTDCPPGHAPTDAGTAGAPCSSQADCAADEACFTGGPGACLGAGTCGPRNSCGTCSPEGSPQCQVCGCDGVTYESIQAACVAGSRSSMAGPCGVPHSGMYELVDGGIPRIPCGLSSQCPTGSACCGITGQCYDSSQPWRCQPFADGGVPNCVSDLECAIPHLVSFCDGTGCGAPGICRYGPRECGGEVVPVCGCNGVTYTNECWARHAGVRVGSLGGCGDAGR